MKDEIQEQVSALVDGELPSHEREFLLRRMEHDADLRDRWERYHLISDAMRYNLPQSIDVSLADRVMAEVQQESANVPVSRAAHGQERFGSNMLESFFKPVAGLAIAASVAVFSLFGVQNMLHSGEQAEGGIQLASSSANPSYVRASGTRWDTTREEIENRLTGYLVNHSEYASATSLQGMVPYVRIAGYDVRR